MSLIRLRHDPSRRELNWFAFFWLAFFGLAATWIGWRFGWSLWTWATLAAALAVPLAGWFQPWILRAAWLGLSYLTFPIGYVVSHVVLAAVYYLVLTPVGLVMRLVGYDPLQRGWNPQAESYWEPKPEPPPAERYFQQY
jgi:hypothetical protein